MGGGRGEGAGGGEFYMFLFAMHETFERSPLSDLPFSIYVPLVIELAPLLLEKIHMIPKPT